MALQVPISNETAEWLAVRADAEGTDQGTVAARILVRVMQTSLSEAGRPNSMPLAKWQQKFERWTCALKGRGGRAYAARISIYDPAGTSR
jgi:hypothetical protein